MSKQTPYAQSPFVQIDFAAIQADPGVLSIQEEAYCGHVNLRGSASNDAFLSAAKAVLGTDLPTEVNTFVITAKLTVLWYGPNEWLIVTPQGSETALIATLREALQGQFFAVTDLSGGNTVLNISGSHAIDLLKKGCPLDLHSSAFAVGQCAQTVLAKAGMTILNMPEPAGFKLIVRRSFSDYLGVWLIDAAGEFAALQG